MAMVFRNNNVVNYRRFLPERNTEMGIRHNKGKGFYYLDYRVNGKRIREKVGPNKKLAESIWAKRQTEIAENKFLDKRKEEKIRFRDFAQVYLENHAKVNKRSWASTDVHYLKRLNEYFGNKLLFEITAVDIERYKAGRLAHVSPAYVNRELACLKCLFNKAIQWGKFYRINPVTRVKLFKENNKRVRYLEKAEMFRLLDECKGEIKAMVMLAANTGMRRGEILNLKWSDVDLHSDHLYVRKSKSGESRIIPLNRSAKETLYGLSLKKQSGGDYVFEQRHRDGFEAAVARAKIQNFRFHDLRHHFASHAAMAGMDMNTLRELLGHKTLTMTLRYAHLSPSHKAQAVKLLDTFWTLSDVHGVYKTRNFAVTH